MSKIDKLKKISELNSAELEAIRKIDQDFLNYYWNDYQWDDYLKTYPNETIFGLSYLANGEIGTFALFLYLEAENSLHLLKVVSRSEQRRRGNAKRLLRNSISWMNTKGISKMFLEVATHNVPAINLYKGLGFKVLVEKKRFYSDGSNAFSMLLDTSLL